MNPTDRPPPPSTARGQAWGIASAVAILVAGPTAIWLLHTTPVRSDPTDRPQGQASEDIHVFQQVTPTWVATRVRTPATVAPTAATRPAVTSPTP